jgi:hypothetical protein
MLQHFPHNFVDRRAGFGHPSLSEPLLSNIVYKNPLSLI